MKPIITDTPFPDYYPQEWCNQLDMDNTSIYEYRNLQHFKQHVSTLTQIEDDKCGVTYATALKDLLTNKATMTEGDYQIIKNRIKQNLLKRGLISDTIYESYKYDVEGEIWDVAKVIAQDPMCCLVPNESYTNYFYELYISVSYPWTVSDSEIIENMAKILATVELLEQEHYYCKITLVFPDKRCNTGNGKSNFLAMVPLFSYKDFKSIDIMSSVLNERLLRKFFFAVLEDKYGEDLSGGYGTPIDLEHAIIPVDLDEVELAESIINKVIVPCNPR